MVIKAKDIFTPDEYERIKFILKLFNGKIIQLIKPAVKNIPEILK